MSRIKIRYLIQKGNCYYWQPSTRLRTLGWESLELGTNRRAAIDKAEEQNRILDAWRKGDAATPEKSPGEYTMNDLATAYLESPRFKKRAANTQKDYKYKISLIKAWAGNVPVEAITRGNVHNFYEALCAKKGLRMGHAVIAILRLLLQYAVDAGKIRINPAARPKTETPDSRDIVWTPQEQNHMVKTADNMQKKAIGTAIICGACLGQREADILSLDWNKYSHGFFRLKQQKTDRWIEVPAHKTLKERLAGLIPEVGGLIVKADSYGGKMKQSYFSHEFQKVRDEAAKTMPSCARLKFLDLRRTAVVRMAEAGCTEAEISSVTGHKIETCRQILETYLPRTSRMAKNAINKVEAIEETAWADRF